MQKVRIFHLQNVGWENFEISIHLVTLLYRKQPEGDSKGQIKGCDLLSI